MAYDFVIAGGGIGGAVLAHLLGRGGKRVLVLERSLGAPPFIRPEGLWPATAKLLRSLLQGSGTRVSPPLAIAESWVPLKGVRVLERGRALLDLDESVFERAGARLAMTDPNRTREELLKLEGFELRRGVEVLGVLKDGARIAGVRARALADGKEEEISAAWTIGDDGVNSRVRDGCGIELRTKMLPLDLMSFGFDWPASLTPAVAHIFLNPARTRSGIFGLGAVPMPGGKGAVLVPVRPKQLDANARVAEDWTAFVASDVRIADVAGTRSFPKDLARIKRPWGHAARYGIEGAVLIGDAAHPVSPAGGQGANMAVADAAALAGIFLSGTTKDVIGEFERHRRAANERSIGFTRSVARVMSWPAWLVDWAMPAGLRYVQKRPPVFERVIRRASEAFQESAAK